jgi:hypothetical protein
VLVHGLGLPEAGKLIGGARLDEAMEVLDFLLAQARTISGSRSHGRSECRKPASGAASG